MLALLVKITDVVSLRSEDPKLIICVITFELTQRIRPRYHNVTDRQTDEQTTYDSNTALALRASHSKKRKTHTATMNDRKATSVTLFGPVARFMMRDGLA